MNYQISKNFYDISKIHSDWKSIKLKYILSISDHKSPNFTQEKILSLTQRGIVERDVSTNEGQIAESYEKYILVKQGQICMNPMDLLSGWVDISSYDGLISPAYYTFILNNEFNNKFINYFLQSNYLRKTFFKIGKGVSSHDNFGRWVLTPEELKNIFIFFPEIEEQKLISKYLEKKMQQIKLLIEKTKKKIEILTEQRTSFINHFVTKGLDPKVEMKDSGIEWMGKIPKHWSLKKIKYSALIELSSVDRHEYDSETKVSICHYNDTYKNEYIDKKTSLPLGTCTSNELDKFKLKKGDIVLTKDSESPEDIGIPTFIEDDLDNTVCGYHLALIRTDNKKIESEFLYRYIESKTVRDYFYICSNGITRYGLGKPSIKNLLVPVIPTQEQIQIVKKIRKLSFSINNTHSLLLKKIRTLKEHRKSLIFSFITGKVRVTKDMI